MYKWISCRPQFMSGFTSEYPPPPDHFRLFDSADAIAPPAVPEEFSVHHIFGGSVLDEPAAFDGSKDYRSELLKWMVASALTPS